MKIYRLRHVPTGLFFTRTKHTYNPREKMTNLTDLGELYWQPPTGLKSTLENGNGQNIYHTGRLVKIHPGDLEIVEYDLNQSLPKT